MRCVLSTLLMCALFAAAAASAQTPAPPAPPTEIQILVLPSTGSATTVAPVASWTTPLTSAECNLDKIPVGSSTTPLVNPDFVYFDDPANATRDCRVPIPATLPQGTGYRAVGVFIAPSCNPTGTLEVKPCLSARSAVAVPPFSIVNPNTIPPPSAPTSLRVTTTP